MEKVRKFLIACMVYIPMALYAQEGQEIRDVEAFVDGQRVKILIQGEESSTLFCGLTVFFGDGTQQDFRMERRGPKFPLQLTKVYERPGDYVIKVEGRRVSSRRGCHGVVTTVVRVGKTDSANQGSYHSNRHSYVAPDQPDNLGSNCPMGWNKIYEDSKTGAFSCQVSPPSLYCAPGLIYFNEKDRIGCRSLVK